MVAVFTNELPTSTFPKIISLVEKVRFLFIPVPFKFTVSGLVFELLTNINLPVLIPSDKGLNLIV